MLTCLRDKECDQRLGGRGLVCKLMYVFGKCVTTLRIKHTLKEKL